MRLDARSLPSLVAAASLGIPGAGIILEWLQNPALYPSTLIEDGVLAILLTRAALYLVLPRVRRMKPSNLVVLLSGDILMLPVAVGLYLLTGDYFFDAFQGAYLAAWLSSALVVYPLVASYAITAAMLQRSRLSAVVPSAAGAFVLSTEVLGRLGGAPAGQGLSSVARLTLAVGGKAAQSAGTDALVLGCGALLFVSLAAYSFVAESARTPAVPALAVGVAGVAALLGWTLLVPDVQPWASYGVPSAAAAGVIWVVARER